MKRRISRLTAGAAALAVIVGAIGFGINTPASAITSAQCDQYVTTSGSLPDDATFAAGLADTNGNGTIEVCIAGGVTLTISGNVSRPVIAQDYLFTTPSDSATSGKGKLVVQGNFTVSNSITFDNLDYEGSGTIRTRSGSSDVDFSIINDSSVTLLNPTYNAFLNAERNLTISDSTVSTSATGFGNTSARILSDAGAITISNSTVTTSANGGEEARAQIDAPIGISIVNSTVTTNARPANGYTGLAMITTAGAFTVSGSNTVVTANIVCRYIEDSACNAWGEATVPTLGSGLAFYKDDVQMIGTAIGDFGIILDTAARFQIKAVPTNPTSTTPIGDTIVPAVSSTGYAPSTNGEFLIAGAAILTILAGAGSFALYRKLSTK